MYQYRTKFLFFLMSKEVLFKIASSKGMYKRIFEYLSFHAGRLSIQNYRYVWRNVGWT